MKVKNISDGKTAVKTRSGIIVIAPNEVKELQENTLLTRLHPSLVIVTDEPQEDTKQVDVKNSDVTNSETTNSDAEQNGTQDVTLTAGEAITKDKLEAKLKSLRASWKRARRVAVKEQISKEIKGIEKQLETMK